jgi:hypothetical protein
MGLGFLKIGGAIRLDCGKLCLPTYFILYVVYVVQLYARPFVQCVKTLRAFILYA